MVPTVANFCVFAYEHLQESRPYWSGSLLKNGLLLCCLFPTLTAWLFDLSMGVAVGWPTNLVRPALKLIKKFVHPFPDDAEHSDTLSSHVHVTRHATMWPWRPAWRTTLVDFIHGEWHQPLTQFFEHDKNVHNLHSPKLACTYIATKDTDKQGRA